MASRHLANGRCGMRPAPGGWCGGRSRTCTAATRSASARSRQAACGGERVAEAQELLCVAEYLEGILEPVALRRGHVLRLDVVVRLAPFLKIQRLVTDACQRQELQRIAQPDRKSTRLNSSHVKS